MLTITEKKTDGTYEINFTSEDLLVLLIGTRLFGDKTLTKELNEVELKQLDIEKCKVYRHEINSFAFNVAEEISEMNFVKSLRMSFPGRDNKNEWAHIFLYENGRFYCPNHLKNWLYNEYLKWCRTYPFICFSKALAPDSK